MLVKEYEALVEPERPGLVRCFCCLKEEDGGVCAYEGGFECVYVRVKESEGQDAQIEKSAVTANMSELQPANLAKISISNPTFSRS